MSEIAAPAPVAPVSESTAPVATKAPEVEPSEEYEIDGKKVTLTRTQARTAIQKAAASEKRFKEAADMRSKAEDVVRSFDGDLEEALRKLGKDPEKLFADHLAKKAKLALMSPEQIEADRIKVELESLRQEKSKSESEKKAAKQAEIDLHNSKTMESQIIAAADKHGLDSSPETLVELIDIADDFLNHEIVPTAEQLAQEFLRRESEHIEQRDRKQWSKLSGKRLLAYLGNDGLAKVKAAMAEADAESLKSIPQPTLKPRAALTKPIARDSKGQYVRESDFDKKFGL